MSRRTDQPLNRPEKLPIASVRVGRVEKSETILPESKNSGRFTIVDSASLCAGVGPLFRPPRLGPELDLLERFLESARFSAPIGCETTVFREPRLESGFPDLVIVFWDRKKTEHWQKSRTALTLEDLRLAHYVHNCGTCPEKQLLTVFPGRGRSLDRLTAAGMLERTRNAWRLRPLSYIFAAQQIIAVEAKVAEWRRALEQARLNTWFASASFVLVPNVPKRSLLLEKAKAIGVGVWTDDNIPIELEPVHRLPRSYASWLFNEWAWRAGASIK